MKIRGMRDIAASPDFVWLRLNDPGILRLSIAGCESMRVDGAGEFVASLKLRFGPVTAAFDGRLSLCNIVDNRSYSIVFEGLGGVAGFGRGVADVTLESRPPGTRLQYAVEAEIGGTVARIGRPLVRRIARHMIDDFFTRFERAVVAAAQERS